MKIVIEGKFPGLNEFITANRIMKGRYSAGNTMKHKDQRLIEYQLPPEKIKSPAHYHFTFYCVNRRQDPDNVCGYFHKIFFDALVARRLIEDDGWGQISSISDGFMVDKKRPRVEIEVEEV